MKIKKIMSSALSASLLLSCAVALNVSAADPTNVALNKTVTSTRSGVTAEQLAQLTDNNTTTQAFSYYGSETQSFTVDLSSEYTVSSVVVYSGWSNSGGDYYDGWTISYSADGTAYTSAEITKTQGNDYSTVCTLDTPTVVRYVKITHPKLDSARTFRYREIQVFGVEYTSEPEVTATVTADDNNGSAPGLIDGDTENASAYNTNSGVGAWVPNNTSKTSSTATVDMGEVKSVSNIKLYMGYKNGGADAPAAYAVSYSLDGVTYADLQSGNGAEEVTISKSFTARYIKLNVTKAERSDIARVREMAITSTTYSGASGAPANVSASPVSEDIQGANDTVASIWKGTITGTNTAFTKIKATATANDSTTATGALSSGTSFSGQGDVSVFIIVNKSKTEIGSVVISVE